MIYARPMKQSTLLQIQKRGDYVEEKKTERFPYYTGHEPITRYIPTGIENAVSLETLAGQAHMDKDHMKEWIRQERRNMVIIFAPACGYWRPSNPPTRADREAARAMVEREEKQATSRFVTMRFTKQWLAEDEKKTSLDFGEVKNNGE